MDKCFVAGYFLRRYNANQPQNGKTFSPQAEQLGANTVEEGGREQDSSSSEFQVVGGVSKPDYGHKTRSSSLTYPLDKMRVGDHFIVPKSRAKPDDTPAKFRNRIHQNVASYARRVNRNRAANIEKVSFSTILLGEPTSPMQIWHAGDIGVWRDS